MRAFTFLALFVLLSSCRKEAPPSADVHGLGPVKAPQAPVPKAPTELRIRVQNQGTAVLGDVKVNFHGQSESFGDLQPGAFSEYRRVKASYKYGLSEATVGGKRVKLQPIDFFGEKLLPPGDYTWGLAPGGTEQLDLVLTHD